MAATLIKGAGGDASLPSGFNAKITAWAGTLTSDTEEVTSFDGSGWKEFIETCSSFTGSVNGYVQYDDANTQPAPFSPGSHSGDLTLIAQTGCTLIFSAIITSVNLTRTNCQAMPVTFNFTANGAVTSTWDESGA